jgi:flavin-dependent dehydrogenase
MPDTGRPGAWDVDVAVLGGGLAGLTLANQLRLERPDLSVVVLEKAVGPCPEAAHKVGESITEIAALYLGRVLGLAEHCDEAQLRKFGLRFFFGGGAAGPVGQRTEYGASEYLPVRTWQLDRGRLENELAARARDRGARVEQGARVVDVDLGDPAHTVRYEQDGEARALTARFVADASGRRAVLKKKLGLGRTVPHEVNAAWFRVPGELDVDAWCDDPAFRGFVGAPRRLSTNHLLGPGYWVWLIPLASGATSVGIVAEEARHPFSSIASAEAALAWLRAHEPECARHVEAAGPWLDFLALRRFCHNAERIFSPDRWALLGDAGIFLDPFYSPGSDYIAMINTFAVDLVGADADGRPDLAERTEAWNQRMLTLFRAFLHVYRGRYAVMGTAAPMRTKITWDITTYWSSYAQVYAAGGHADLRLLRATADVWKDLYVLTFEMQDFFARWAEAEGPTVDLPGERFDYGTVDWMRSLNAALLDRDLPADEIARRLRANLGQLRELAAEVVDAARARNPGLAPPHLELPRPTRERLGWLRIGATGVDLTARTPDPTSPASDIASPASRPRP